MEDENSTLGIGYRQLKSYKTKANDRHSEKPIVPRDRCSGIYIALILCGAGFLLPYNSFVTAVDYYQDKFPGTTIIFDMSLTYICVAFVGVLVNNFVVELLSLQSRITFGYIISFLMLLFIALCDIWFRLFDHDTSYWLTLVAVATVALGCTVQQSSFYGYTSMLPRRYTQAVMTGESAAGLIISINRILTKALLDDERINTIIFFLVSIGIVLACSVTFHVTVRTEFARFYMTMCIEAGVAEDERGLAHPHTNYGEVCILNGPHSQIQDETVHRPVAPPPCSSEQLSDQSSIHCASTSSSTADLHEIGVKGQNISFRRYRSKLAAIKSGLKNRYQVARAVWPYMLSIGVTYFVTLCLFPGIESEVISCRLKSWMPIIVMGTFNLFDFIGKIVASINYDWPRGRLVVLSMCRLVLVPLMMMCVTPRLHPSLRGEAWPLLFSLLLGISNGYFGSVPMILAGGKVPDEQKELTGNIMTLSYSVGLTTGSVTAYLLDEWLGPRLTFNPCSPLWNSTITDYHVIHYNSTL